MTNFLNQLKEDGVLVFDTSVPISLSDYTLNYNIPRSEGRLIDQVELDYRTVDDNFPYSQLLKEIIYKAAGEPEDIKDILFNCPDVIVQELKPNTMLGWHHDAHVFDDGSRLKFEALLYISNVTQPHRHFMWKKKDVAESLADHILIQHGTIIFIDCENETYVHAAIGTHDSSEKVITLLLGCR